MNSQECANLVERIIQTWPNGPRGRIWTEALTDLDPGRAGTAYVRLRDEAEQAPTIGKFMAIYRSLDTSRTHAWRRPDEPASAISLDEYLERLATRAERGDHHAADELQTWARWRRTPLHLVPPVDLFDDTDPATQEQF